MKTHTIGLIGLGVMGKNLLMNFIDKGYSVAIFDSDVQKIQQLSVENQVYGAKSLNELILQLQSPRKILLMINAGPGIDDLLNQLIPLLSSDDIIIDGGNSYYKDTIRRELYAREFNINFVGIGISGGAKGALYGPSIMVGGSKFAWNHTSSILTSISAKYNNLPSCAHLGPDGAGHYVKMVHNGIEYGIMQLISEIYDYMRKIGKLTNEQIKEMFSKINVNNLSSYLLSITTDIFDVKDGENHLIDLIDDTAQQKGTGRWTAIDALDIGNGASIINTAVIQRIISSKKSEREEISQIIPLTDYPVDAINEKTLYDTLLFASILTYYQGFLLIQESSVIHNWNIDLKSVLSTWRSGCIIQSELLGLFEKIFDNHAPLSITQDTILSHLLATIESTKIAMISAVKHDLPMPCISTALNYFISMKTSNLPSNLIQAQRDYFGNHGYTRIDDPLKIYSTNWDELFS
ncbi:MAG: NADP-dependent phosphogluconate dehydrogenase [Candidatus Heimdallarchaeota archaeon]|nr:NADP-dependent phosphogluconate dehydrogenase [Candidatus Heimdallarchaeota archaeon]